MVIAALLPDPKFLASIPKIPFPETMRLRMRGFFRARNNSCRMCHCKVKCRKALWLQLREALWSNCKRTQSSESRFFLCKKYELLLRSLRNKTTTITKNNNTKTHKRTHKQIDRRSCLVVSLFAITDLAWKSLSCIVGSQQNTSWPRTWSSGDCFSILRRGSKNHTIPSLVRLSVATGNTRQEAERSWCLSRCPIIHRCRHFTCPTGKTGSWSTVPFWPSQSFMVSGGPGMTMEEVWNSSPTLLMLTVNWTLVLIQIQILLP